MEKASLHTAIDSKVNTESQELNIGDEGITITRLSIGKARINGNVYEVQSTQGIIEQNSEIIVNKIEGYKIFVTQKLKIMKLIFLLLSSNASVAYILQ